MAACFPNEISRAGFGLLLFCSVYNEVMTDRWDSACISLSLTDKHQLSGDGQNKDPWALLIHL